MKSVGIVGAGISGIITAKVFAEYGFDVKVFEKESEIGGVWASSRSYPGLTTQNPRDTYAYAGYPMPSEFPEWPSGKQVALYLSRFIKDHDLIAKIRLDSEVMQVSEEPGGWRVLVKKKQRREPELYRFDFLVICNGVFSEPLIPTFEGQQEFIQAGGRILHTSETKDNFDDQFKGRHVLVVGYGKSSCDVATAASGYAKSTTLVARTIIWKIPKKFFGLLNMKFILLTRLGENLFEYIRTKGFAKFLHRGGKPIRNFLLKSVEMVVARQLRLKAVGLLPKSSLESIVRANISLATDGFFERVADGTIAVKRDATIKSLKLGLAELSTGELIPADVIVCGTGFKQQVPFLDKAIAQRVFDNNGDFFLYRNQVPLELPNLGFNGYNSSLFSQLNAEVGAVWLAEYFTGGLKLPPIRECIKLTAERLAWSNRRTEGKNARGTNIIPFSLAHVDELLEDMDASLHWSTKLKQWLLPVNPGDYAPYIKKIIDRRKGK